MKQLHVQETKKSDPIQLGMKPSTYQPSKADKEESKDMPSMAIEVVRTAFERRFKVKEARQQEATNEISN